MKLFLKNIILFCLLGLLFGEAVSRYFNTTSDIPSRVIDKNGIQKYKPNQNGHWVGGTHKWSINEDGWPGKLPKTRDNLITIIGDSYIENFMNPDSCRQAELLRKSLPKYNYYEASRSGISFIEALEIASKLDTLQPLQQLIYLHDNDFLESVSQLQKMGHLTQFDTENERVVPGSLKAPFLKKILYNWKFMYYIYNNYSFTNKKETTPINELDDSSPKPDLIISRKQSLELEKLYNYASKSYDIKRIILVLRPNPNKQIIEMLNKYGFNTIILQYENNINDWSFEYDAHWTCVGHKKAANQVINALTKGALLQ